MFDILRQHPLYICDFDDSYDRTYASIMFNVTEDMIKAINERLKERRVTREETQVPV